LSKSTETGESELLEREQEGRTRGELEGFFFFREGGRGVPVGEVEVAEFGFEPSRGEVAEFGF
jgi:hypothetical protein